MFSVMIVDDQEVVRMQMKRLKIWGEPSGFIITEEAVNGQDAIEKFQRNPADLVITDIRMPKVDGIELLRYITKLEHKSCVVFLSDYSEFNYAKEGMKHGAFDYLIKPVKEQEIIGLLANVKAHLEEKKKMEKVLKGYGNDHYEQSVDRFIHEISQHILKADKKVQEICSHFVDWLDNTFGDNELKKVQIITEGQKEVLNAICIQHSWLTMLRDYDEMISFELTQVSYQDNLKEDMMQFANKMITLINEYQYVFLSNELTGNVCKYVLKNMEQEITLSDIAESLFMNKTYLSDVFKQKTGITIGEFITKVKIERSKLLLRQNKLKNYEIAYGLGYKDVDYFSKLFKKAEGISPSQYRSGIRRL